MTQREALQAAIAEVAAQAEEFVTEGTVQATVAAIARERELDAIADDLSCRAVRHEAYKEAIEEKKTLLGGLEPAVKKLRSRLMAYLLDGGTAAGAHVRRKGFAITVTDEKALPDSYKKTVVDMDKLTRVVNALGGEAPIPGVTVTAQFTLVVATEKE